MLPRHKNLLQDEVDKIVILCEQRNQRLNNSKTKTMIFNPLRAYDIALNISISPGTVTEVVEQYKILGTIVRLDLKTISN